MQPEHSIETCHYCKKEAHPEDSLHFKAFVIHHHCMKSVMDELETMKENITQTNESGKESLLLDIKSLQDLVQFLRKPGFAEMLASYMKLNRTSSFLKLFRRKMLKQVLLKKRKMVGKLLNIEDEEKKQTSSLSIVRMISHMALMDPGSFEEKKIRQAPAQSSTKAKEKAHLRLV